MSLYLRKYDEIQYFSLLKMKIVQKFKYFNTSEIRFCNGFFRKPLHFFSNIRTTEPNHGESELIQREYDILNVSPHASLKEIYESYKRFAIFYNPNAYFEHDRDYKYKPIKEAYLKIISQKQQEKNLLNQEDLQTLDMLMKKSDYGLLFERKNTKTDLIVDETEKEIPWREPENLASLIFWCWLFLGVSSFAIDIYELATETRKNMELLKN